MVPCGGHGFDLFLVDFHRVWHTGWVPRWMRVRDLAQLRNSLALTRQNQWRFLTRYAEHARLPAAGLTRFADSIERSARSMNAAHLRSRTRRCLKESTEFTIQRTGSSVIYRQRRYAQEEIQSLLELYLHQPSRLNPVILKRTDKEAGTVITRPARATRVRDTWFRAEKVGVYRGQCAELCGKDHAFMPIVVRVVSSEDYTKWVNEKNVALAAAKDDPKKTWELAELKERGAKVYAANCQACHQANGQGVKGAFPSLDGSQVVMNKEQQIAIVLNGKGAMPPWKQLSDVELAAVATYVKNSWGSSAGTAVQPAELAAARK